MTVHNESYFRNNPFTETQAKLDFLKAEVSKLGNVSILDGTVEEFEGVKFGGTMAFNDFCWAYKVNLSRKEIWQSSFATGNAGLIIATGNIWEMFTRIFLLLK